MKKHFQNILLLAFAIVFAVNLQAFSLHDSLKFAQLSDSHLTTTRKDTSFKVLSQSVPLLEDAVSQINDTQGLDFVMHTGDTADYPVDCDVMKFMGIMNRLRYPWYMAFGNHDLSVSGDMTRDRYLELLRGHNRNFDFTQSYYSFKPKKGYKVIVLDAVDNSKITGNGIFPPEELEWLDGELKSAKKDTVLIFLHHPILEPFSSPHHKVLNADEFYAVIDKYKNPIAIFTGHYHAAKITQNANVLHVSTPALVTYPNAFRIVNVQNYKDKTIFDFYFKPTNLKEIQIKAKLKNMAAHSCAGAECDQTTTIVIDK